MVQRPEAGSIPDTPGSYQFKDAEGRVIYVGKAKSLRSRLSNYFAHPATLHPRTAQMVATAETVEWIQVRNEVEALMLEFSLIKQHRPRFNVRLVDDKSYPFMAITLLDEWPRARVMRGARKKGVRYFGPYAHAYAIRETLDLLLRTFPIRTCSDNKLERHHRQGRPCLLFHIEKCSGPCVGEIDHETYDGLVRELIEFLEGDTEPVVTRLEQQMQQAATDLEFEQAARLRDRLASVRRAIEKQQMVVDRNEDLDVIGLVEDELEAAAQIFYVRRGRVVGRRGFVLDKVMELEPGEVIATVLEELYYDEPPLGMPKQVLVPTLPDDASVYERWLSEHRGSRVEIRVPQRGDKRRLAGDRHPERDGGLHPAPAASGVRSQQPGPGAQRAAGVAGPARGAAAHRVLRHEPHPGHRLRGLDGRRDRRSGRQARVPALQGEDRRRQRRLRGDGGGADAALHELRRAIASCRSRSAASSSTRPSCWWSTAARGS